MKRSLVSSALFLVLAMPLAACGGGSASTDPPKDATDPAAQDQPTSGDPVADMQTTMDGLQKSVDDVLQPLKDSDALLTSLGTLNADLKAAKSKIDAKKAMLEIKKASSGGEPSIDSLKIKDGDPGKAIIQDRIDKTKALFASVNSMDQKVKDLAAKITDAVPALVAAAAKVLPKLEAKIRAPFGVSADDKKKATDDKAKIMAMSDNLKAKAAEWQKLLTDLPPKAKDLPPKFAALK